MGHEAVVFGKEGGASPWAHTTRLYQPRLQSQVEGEDEQARGGLRLAGSSEGGGEGLDSEQDKADGMVCEMQTDCWCVGVLVLETSKPL